MSTIETLTESRRMSTSLRVDAGKSMTVSNPVKTRRFDPNATIILVGSRGSGKRSLGFIGATHLGRRLITEDHYFQETTGLSRKAYLSNHGKKEFCRKNVEVLQRMLQENSKGAIIECGLGSLAKDAQETLKEYCNTHPVIYIIRNPDRVRKLLKLSEAAYKRLEYADLVHRSCSNFEYYNLHDPSCESQMSETSQDRASPYYSFGLKDAKQDFSNYLDFVSGRGLEQAKFESPFSLAAVSAEHRPHTHALSLRLSDLLRPDLDISALDSGGGDVVELRIDVWVANMLSIIDKQISMIRRHIGVPIIFNVDEDFLREPSMTLPGSDTQNSLYPLPHFLGPTVLAREDAAMILLRHSLRLGVEYAVVLLDYRDDTLRELLEAKGATKIIGQYTVKGNDPHGWKDSSLVAIYRKAELLGCDVVRLLRVATSPKDNDEVRSFSQSLDLLPEPHPPLIAYNLGELGKPSLVTNKVFSPVTHPSLKMNQGGNHQSLMTAAEAMEALFRTSIVNGLRFYVVGAKVSYSLSPAMHVAAYKACGLNHDFQVRQISTMEDLQQISHDSYFGGAALAQPFKVKIMAHLHAYSNHARAVGAVNTLIPLRSTPNGPQQSPRAQASLRNKSGPIYAWYGDNTDWIGVMTCLRRNTSPRNVVQPSKTTGLVIGAGGMARAAIYAMIQLGCRKIFIYNRTLQNAEAVAAHFNAWAAPISRSGPVVTVLQSRNDPWPSEHQPPTLLVSCIPKDNVSQPTADLEMPSQWLSSPSGGVVIEMSYVPRDTPLLRQIRKLGAAWGAVDFLEVLPEQGIAQFELFTGRRAPRSVMRAEVRRLSQLDDVFRSGDIGGDSET